ncbi:MAG: caa(3)-type oxidase subunit IV [bacterium]|nr:caa(3)-type oxidase subunit IV [bacterium]
MSEHHSLKPYVFVLVGLLILTWVTYGAALWDFGHPWSDLVALLIAMTKASLVVVFFMHVKGATPLIKMAAVGGFFWLLIFGAFVLADVLTRPGMLEFL